jgi:hypothetical protein
VALVRKQAPFSVIFCSDILFLLSWLFGPFFGEPELGLVSAAVPGPVSGILFPNTLAIVKILSNTQFERLYGFKYGFLVCNVVW